MNLKNLPSGWLPATEAIKRIVWSKHPGRGAKERDVAEEAWRELCGHAFEGRIGAVIRTESDVALEADCAQFITLQERYLFHAGTQGYWLEDEQRYGELEIKPEEKFLDKHGHSARGQLLFRESDLEALFAEGPPEKASLNPVLVPGKKPRRTQTKPDALTAFLLDRYPTRPAKSVDELIREMENEASHIGGFGKRTFETALTRAYPKP